MAYRILSLDGGGSWALIEVRALQEIYGDISGHDLLKHFDLVAANSGGSIVAAGLALNFKLSELLKLFSTESIRKQIFVQLEFTPLPWVFGIGAKYSAAEKLPGLQAALGPKSSKTFETVAGEIKERNGKGIDFLITSFDYDRRRAVYFRSNANSVAASFPHQSWNSSIAEVVHASTNAPVNYFDKPAVEGDHRYWDGAVSGLNNPCFAAVVEALSNGNKPEDIEVLSIGTASVSLPQESGSVKPPLATKRQDPGLINDLKELATSILDDPPDAASFHAHIALAQKLPGSEADLPTNGSVFRLNPLIQPKFDGQTFQLPPGYKEETFAALTELGIDAIENPQVLLIQNLCEDWINGKFSNQPIRSGVNFRCEIGFPTFQEAKRAWKLRAGL